MPANGPSSPVPPPERLPAGRNSVVTIGTFDGVHRGHQALVARARERATLIGPHVRVAALVFDPNPIEVLRPAQAPARLTTFEQKRDWLLAAGADEVHRLEPTSALLHESPGEFLAIIQREHGMVGVVEGPDFRFGKGRAGDVRTLAELGSRMGFGCDIVEPVSVALNDHTIAPARSTIVRWLIGHGRVADARCVLGRPYTLRGTVVRGDQRGRTIGFPTANLQTPCMTPADGVYAGRARLADGRAFPAAISVGTKPTFGPNARAIEAVLLNPAAGGRGVRREAGASDCVFGSCQSHGWQPIPNLPEYGWTLDLELIAWIREQIHYDSLEGLLAQMGRDCALAIELLDLRAESPLELETTR